MKSYGILVPIIFLIAILLWLWGVNFPFVGLYSTNNNYLMLAARNYLRFGWLNLKLLPTYYTGSWPVPENAFYLHHPLLIYLTAIPAFVIFGFKNWTVHVSPFIFNTASVGIIYILAKELYNRKIALLSAMLAALFPLMTFFWKIIFFEPITLFFDLFIFYSAVKYLKKANSKYIYLLIIGSFLAGLSDWPAIYLLVPFCLLFFTKYRPKALLILLFYSVPVFISLGIFLVLVLITKGSFTDLFAAGIGRAVSREMTAVPFWWFKLPINYLLRLMIYFTPLSLVFLLFGLGKIIQSNLAKLELPNLALLMLFILGVSNTVFFLTTSWSFSYFLYYFIPFLAISGAVFLQSLKSARIRILLIAIFIGWSIFINFLKIKQWEKHLWKKEALDVFAGQISSRDLVGVADFPGDLVENYYLTPTVVLSRNEIIDWFKGKKYTNLKNLIYACPTVCGPNDFALAEMAQTSANVFTFRHGQDSAWLFIKRDGLTVVPRDLSTVSGASHNFEKQGKLSLTKIYEFIKEFLNIGQL